MKGSIMSLADHLKAASDEEIIEAGWSMRKSIAKNFIFSIALSVAAHFASEIIIGAIERKKTSRELTE